MKIGILLYEKPETLSFDVACKLCMESLSQGHEVKIFLMVDAVRGATDHRIEEIIKRGGKVILCQYNADMKGAPTGRAISGSQYDLAQIVKECDRFLAFT